MSFEYAINLKEAVLELPIDKQLELSLFLLQGAADYTDMFISDGDYPQYRRLLAIHCALSSALPILKPIDPSDLILGK